MRPATVVEVEVAPDRCTRLGRGVVGSEIHFLVFDAAPQPLDEDIVPPGALAVHADGDPVFDQHASECRAGELAALIGVDDLRLALSKPALVSAPSKKSFSSVSSPIFACSDFTSKVGCVAPLPAPGPKTSAAPPSS